LAGADGRRPLQVAAVLAGTAVLAAACTMTPAASMAPRVSRSSAATQRPAAQPRAAARARRLDAARYLAIATPANRRLDRDFDDGINGPDRDRLAAAEADLLNAAATERSFDRQLMRMPLPPGTEAIARMLVAANQSRARLTDQAAGSASLAQLRAFEPRLTAANGPVESAVREIRIQLGLPPPESS
jgi:hypothetical protein